MPYDPDAFIVFLNAVSVETPLAEWPSLFCHALANLLPGVSDVSIKMDLSYCEAPEVQERSKMLTELLGVHYPNGDSSSLLGYCEGQHDHLLPHNQVETTKHAHGPLTREYYDKSGRIIGAIQARLMRDGDETSKDVDACLDELELFLRQQLTTFISRYHSSYFTEHAVALMVARAHTRFGLTTVETEVLLLLLIGKNYADAATIAGVSVDAIRTRVQHLYRKAECHSLPGLTMQLVLSETRSFAKTT